MKVTVEGSGNSTSILCFKADHDGSCEVEFLGSRRTMILSSLWLLEACLQSMQHWHRHLSPAELVMARDVLRRVSFKPARRPCCEVRMELDDECAVLLAKAGPSVRIPLGTFARRALVYFEEHSLMGLEGCDPAFSSTTPSKWKKDLGLLLAK